MGRLLSSKPELHFPDWHSEESSLPDGCADLSDLVSGYIDSAFAVALHLRVSMISLTPF